MPRFEALIAKHPRERYLHYGYGLVLAQRGSAEAVEQYRREIELFPDDVLARVELGFALLAQGRQEEAVAPAEAAVRLAPGLFVTHLVLGRALAATGRVERGIRELETAAALAAADTGDPARARTGVRAGRPQGGRRPGERHLPVAGSGESRRGVPEDPLTAGYNQRLDSMSTTALLLLVVLLALPAGASDAPAAAQAIAAVAAEPFEAASRRARAAREAGRNDEAIAAYREAIGLRPDWDEGLWYLGVLQYETGKCVEADSAFERFLGLKPQAGPGWAIRGVCAFDRGDFPDAIEWLHKGIGLGLGGNAELQRVALSRVAQALVKTGQFELAIGPLTQLSQLSPAPPGLVETTGLALLRLDMLPSEIPEGRRDLAQKLGRAGVAHLGQRGEEAARLYAEVASEYPDTPAVHYAYGVFLLRSGSDKGLSELRRAAELRPDDAMAHLQIAFELLVRGEFAEARDAALKAVLLAPGLFAAHNALGRALVETGDIAGGIRELEAAVRLAPDSAETHFTLARAYAKAGRDEDAARERAAFAELEQRARTAPGTLRNPGPVRP